MTTSKSDLEAKEGQIPNESNFLEFVSLLGSLSSRAGGSSTQEDQSAESKEETEAPQEADFQLTGWFPYFTAWPLPAHFTAFCTHFWF